jgi:KaiC/GvpD/RAD55 family RecA-like ATPase
VSKAPLGIALVIIALTIVSLPHTAASVPSIPNRIFYLSSSGTQVTSTNPGSLTPTLPTSSCTSCTANLTTNPIAFILSPLQAPATVNAPVTLSFWINWKFNNSGAPSLQGALSYRLPGVNSWSNANFTQRFFFGPTNVNVTLPIATTPLIEFSTIAVEIAASSVPKNATILLNWGSSSSRSLLVIPMSGYETLFPTNTITIQDRSQNAASYFYLNAAPPNNLVVVKIFVLSAMGPNDILKVNMTIEDPNLHPVKGVTNETMFGPGSANSPYEYIASWPYASNSTEGTYQILINIVDSQGNIAYTSAPATFGLVPPGFVPFPYNLIPYFIVGAVVAGGGVGGGIAYRRRKRKSYLVPFDHFNSLTGGGLTEGTAVTVEGNTGSGKTLLLEQLMAEDLRNGRPCVFVTTGDFPDSVRSTMKTMGFDPSGYEQNGLLTFVDGYSAEAGKESHEKVSVPSLGDLTTLGVKITSAFPSPSFKGGSLYFDSLTPLASKAKPESIVSLVQSIGAKVKGLSGKAFFTMGLGIDSNVQRQLEDTSDCIVQMEAFEESGNRRRRLKIAKLRARKHLEGWVLFTIEDGKGIIFYSKSPKQ